MVKVFSFLIVLLLAAVRTSAQEVTLVYPQPMRYAKIDGKLQAEVTLVYDGPTGGLGIELAGKPLHFVVEGDSLHTRVPLFGKTQTLTFKKQGHIIKEQEFTPYIPDDWNYFGKGTIDIISSSHQDIAWMNTPDSCRMERIDKIIVPAIDMMQESPEFRFGMEQTLNLMELLHEYPAYEKEAIKVSASGQFGWGATFNQPYEGLESDEQLVRELYLGRKWLLDRFNGRIDARTAFSVDVPGRTLQFPQILARAGVRHLFISRFKEGFCRWYSPDGSNVLTYSPGNYGWAVMFYKYFNIDAPTAMHKLHEVLRSWNTYYASRDIPPHYAVVISNDASGPVFYKQVLAEWNRLVDESGLAIPHLRYTTADQFLDSVDVPGARFDSVAGERPNLWLYIHGPAHYEAIAAKRAAAVHLPASEMFNTIDGLLAGNFNDYPQSAFDTAWYKSIYPDHGWGGKHGDITDSIYRSYLEAGDSIARATLFPALKHIAARVDTRHEHPVLVFNDLSWDRDAPAVLPLDGDPADFLVRDAQGRTIPSQVVNNEQGHGLAIIAEKVPAIGYSTYYLSKGTASPASQPTAPENAYENEYYRIRFGDGGITELYDKQLRQDLLNTTRFAGGDVLDLGYDGLDAGEFTEITPANMRDFDKLSNHASRWSRISDGPVFTTFECRYLLGQDSVIQRIVVYRRLKKIDFEIELPDWKGIRSRQLSFALPLNTADAHLRYDVPMGIAGVHETELQVRPGGWAWGGTYYQKPEEIHPRESQNFVTADTRNFGFTLSSRLAVFDWIDPTRESVSYPVLQAVLLTTQKSCHGEGPWYLQRGRHVFRLSISSHLPGLGPAMAFGIGNNHELYCVAKKTNAAPEPTVGGPNAAPELPERQSFFRSAAPGTLITAIKKADKGDHLVLRVVNMERRPAKDTLRTFLPVEKWQKLDLIEQPLGPSEPGAGLIRLPMGPAAIQTLSLSLKNNLKQKE